ADPLGTLMALMVQVVMTFGMLYALGAQDAAVRYPFFLPLYLTLTTGLTGAMLTGDIFNMFVMVELMVISALGLTAMSDDPLGTEAALKYLYIGIITSICLLIGIGALYAGYGTLNMADLAARVAADPSQPLLWIGIVFLFVTFSVKAAAFPFHFWQPDFHTVAPTPVSAMLSSVVVKFGVYGFMRMTTQLFPAQADAIRPVLLAMGVAGVIFGGLSALGTHNVKRMLAYSTLAQVGLILVGIGWGTPASLAAALVFTINHALIKSAMLMLAGYLASRAHVKSASFDVVEGVGKYAPFAGVLFFLGAMSLAGLPPTNGFVSKLALFSAGAALNTPRGWLVLAAVGVASLLTLVYVMRAFMRVWWQPRHQQEKVKPHGDSLLAPACLIALCIAFGLAAEPLLRAAYYVILKPGI
ncbi:MAG: proton-conducting transporter membrane subunit, partial [Chloroflexi bacterium]|nr:proton-conducting transporter membrane subunit [Chloroflexota bacterium]